MLMDKGFMDSSLFNYRGLTTDSALHGSTIYNTYLRAYNAQVADDYSMIELDSVYSLVGNYLDQGFLPVITLSYDYNFLNPVAYDSGWIDTTDGQLLMTGTGNPFLQESLFVAAVPRDFSYVYNDSIKLVFPQELYFNNRNENIENIEIKINDKEWSVVPVNGEYILVMSPTDIMNWTHAHGYIDVRVDMKFQVYQGFTRNATFTIKFFNQTYVVTQYEAHIESITADLAIIGSNPAKGYAPITFGKDASGNKHTCLTKPLIIVEGIDFGTKENATGCRFGKCGDLGYIDILTGANEDYPELANGPLMIEALVNEGYDIIFLDFHDGATYMENNAMVLVKLIQHINAFKCSNEEIVVAGVSMGGQVAKYALSYMEHHNMPHCVRTYVPFDSPHKGANIPLSIQYFVKHTQDTDPNSKFSYTNLARPASKQLLLRNVHASNEADPFFYNFQNSLQLLGGYPKTTRNVAIINGSKTQQSMGFIPDELLFDWKWSVLRLANIDINLYALCGNKVISAHYDRGLIMLANTLKTKIEYAYINNYSSCNPTDHVPGGYRSDLVKIKEGANKVNAGKVILHHENTVFVPSISGLDINTTDYFYNITLIDDKEPFPSIYPFQAYYAPDENEKHVQISLPNIAWMVNELKRTHVGLESDLTSTYNFGDPLKDRLPSVVITSGATVQVNGNYATGYGTGDVPVAGSIMTVYKRGCSPWVTVQSGGNFIIGDNNTPVNNKGIVYMTKGSYLSLYSGSTLTIYNGSKLVIEEGAELVIEPNAVIVLEGPDAVIEIRGKLRILNNAVLSISPGNSITCGYIHFISNGHITAQGTGSKIDLESNFYHNPVLRISNHLVIPHPDLNASNYVSEFKVSSAQIQIDPDGGSASLTCGSTMNMDNVYIKQISSGEGLGLMFCGQTASFTSTHFFDLKKRGNV